MEQLLTARELSVRLNIPLARLYELTRRKAIPVVRLGQRQLRFDPDALSAWASHGGGKVEHNAVTNTPDHK